MVRSQDCLYSPPLPPSPLSFSALSVNSVLRKTRSLTQIDPSTPLLSHRHSPHAAIPFKIIFFAHPHHLTSIESHSCKKQGSGWRIRCFHPTQALPSISTASKHPTHSSAGIFIIFSHLLHIPLDTRGGATIPCCGHPGLSIFASQVTGHGTLVTSSLRGPANSVSLRYPFPFFSFQLSTVVNFPPPQNFYPPAPKLRHNPAAQGQHLQPIPRTGRIQ
jgi:hypothetical protein